MASGSQQLLFDDPRFKTCDAFGGTLMKKKKGRLTPRPVSVKHPMHVILKSSHARGERSFLKTENRKKLQRLLHKFAVKNGVIVLKTANVGNHLHLMLRFKRRSYYLRFIRGLTAAIAISVGRQSRWNPERMNKFWDYRPFSKIIDSARHFFTTWDYLFINELEGKGYSRLQAREILQKKNDPFAPSD